VGEDGEPLPDSGERRAALHRASSGRPGQNLELLAGIDSEELVLGHLRRGRHRREGLHVLGQGTLGGPTVGGDRRREVADPQVGQIVPVEAERAVDEVAELGTDRPPTSGRVALGPYDAQH
jgi:hypothetical protein